MAIRKVPPTAGHLGQGVAYPLAYDASGRLALSWGMQSVEDAMASIISTAPGERVMQPDFGGAVGLFDPVGDSVEMAEVIKQTVADHEPRVDLDSIEVVIERVDSTGKLELTVTYRVVGEADPRTQTAPYFGIAR